MEFQDIFVFDGVSAFHHEASVLTGSLEQPGILQVFCEITMDLRGGVLHGSAAP